MTIEPAFIVDPRQWCASATSAMPPEVAKERYGSSQKRIHIVVASGHPEPLPTFCARSGFRSLTVAHLSKLVAEFNIKWGEGRKPTLEKDLVPLCVRHFFPEASDDEIMEMCSARLGSKARPQVFQTSFEDEALDAIDAELGDQDMADVAEDERKALRIAKKAKQGPAPWLLTRGSKAAASSEVEADGATPASRTPGSAAGSGCKPGRPEIAHKEYTLAEGRALLPEVSFCTLANHTDRAWVVKYPRSTAPRSRTKAYIPGDSESSHHALMHCLQWAWAAHWEATAADCPHDSGEPQDVQLV